MNSTNTASWSEVLEEEPEGGDRCKVCFDYRLDKTAQVAMDLDLITLVQP